MECYIGTVPHRSQRDKSIYIYFGTPSSFVINIINFIWLVVPASRACELLPHWVSDTSFMNPVKILWKPAAHGWGCLHGYIMGVCLGASLCHPFNNDCHLSGSSVKNRETCSCTSKQTWHMITAICQSLTSSRVLWLQTSSQNTWNQLGYTCQSNEKRPNGQE